MLVADEGMGGMRGFDVCEDIQSGGRSVTSVIGESRQSFMFSACRSRPFSPRRLFATYTSTPTRLRSALRYTGYFCASTISGFILLGAGILIHDALTYSDMHLDRVPVSPLALHPEKGGPKNLPVVRVQVDDEENEDARKTAKRPRLVIVGGGWGAMGVLQNLHPGDYHVTVVSADTFTTFTPLLPCMRLDNVLTQS